MSTPAVVVMTATITPAPGMPGTKRADADVRREEYLAAFRFYLSLSNEVVDHVVLLENSGDDLAAFSAAAAAGTHGKLVTLLACPTDYPADRGKGYGEFLMLDFGMRHLRASGTVDEKSHVWKVTGRLKIRNLAELVTRASADCEVMCDLRSVPLVGERLGGNDWMELRVFGFTMRAYETLFAGQFGAGFVLEKVFFTIVKNAYDTEFLRIQPRFPVQPVVEGVSGYSNRNYSNASYRVKGLIRRAGRRLLPGLWI